MNTTNMRFLPLFMCSFLMGITCNSQNIIWTETFSNGCSAGCAGQSYSGANGIWDQSITGAEGANPNMFFVSCAENNTGLGSCSSGCGTSPNPTMHVSSQIGNAFCPNDCGADYNSGGLCGFAPPAGSCPQTNKRIQSPTIDLTGYVNMTLDFLYLEGGVGTIDNMTLWCFDGLNWVQLADPAKTLNSPCSGNGVWTNFSIALPAFANNNPNFRIGFQWVNNDDGVGTNPSFAVDDIRITTPTNLPPNVSFTASSTAICMGACINFLNNSTYSPGATFSWNFGNGQTSADLNPVNICYTTMGFFTVTLTITDNNGTDTETLTNYIFVGPGPDAGNDGAANVCNNDGLDLNSLLSITNSAGTWSETTPIPSGQFNASTGYFDATNLTPGIYTFSYAVNGTGSCTNSDEAEFLITVTTCNGPIAEISATQTSICIGQGIVFSSASTGVGISAYNWTFNNGSPSSFGGPGPVNVTYNAAGTFPVTLTVTSPTGSDSHIIYVTVAACNAPSAQFAASDVSICPGDCIEFENLSVTSGPSTYVWTFNGGNPPTSNTPYPGPVCYENPGTYQVSLYVSNSVGTDIYLVPITVSDVPVITASQDTLVNGGSSVELSASTTLGDLNWTWAPDNQGDILDCLNNDCTLVEVSPLISTVFTVTASSAAGCEVSEQISVLLNVSDGIGVPTTFSPNGDGLNDLLYVKGQHILEMDFKVFNRYGELVFETTNQTIGWDGNFRLKEEKDANFAWMLRYKLLDGRSGDMNGNVTIVR